MFSIPIISLERRNFILSFPFVPKLRSVWTHHFKLVPTLKKNNLFVLKMHSRFWYYSSSISSSQPCKRPLIFKYFQFAVNQRVKDVDEGEVGTMKTTNNKLVERLWTVRKVIVKNALIPYHLVFGTKPGKRCIKNKTRVEDNRVIMTMLNMRMM